MNAHEPNIIKQLCQFGQVVEFILLRTPFTNQSKMVAYCRFEKALSTYQAVNAKININGNFVFVKRAFLVDNNNNENKMEEEMQEPHDYTSRLKQISINTTSEGNNFVLVGTQRVIIDPTEKPSTVIVISNAYDPLEIENSDKYYEISSEFERQLGKFGGVNSLKFLRRSEGYTTAGNVLAEYDEVEGAILAKSTLKVVH